MTGAFVQRKPQKQTSIWESAPNPFHQKGRSMVGLNAYVPDGFSEAEWKKIKAKEAKANADVKQANAKKRSMGYEDLTDWVKARDAKFPNQPGAGHRFVKTKYDFSGGAKGQSTQSK